MRAKSLLALMAVLLIALFMGCPDTVTSPADTMPPITLQAVPGGTFNNGTANMTVSSFRISQYEVTRAQFLAIMGSDPSNTTYSSGVDNPVQMVTWYDAVEFCNKLSALEGLTTVYTITGRVPATGYPITSATVSANWSSNGYRLPTEAEWQYSARGGNATHDYTYSGSNTVGDVAVFGYAGSEVGRTTTMRSNPVGSKSGGANELGLYDMTGNVWEWCWDWSASYSGTEQTDYHGAASGTYRVMRGGSWSDSASSCTVAYRIDNYPYIQYSNIGFRVVRN